MTNPHSTTDDDSAADERSALSSVSTPPGTEGDGRWSSRLSARFGIHFDAEMCQWWDELAGSVAGGQSGSPDLHWGEFRYCATPQTLLSVVPDPFWPPLMPPNFLPLVGNGAGDWLCLRLLDPDQARRTGISTDICQWYHGGGDWLPWGSRLSEALLFDWSLGRMPQPDRRHAEPAVDENDDSSADLSSHFGPDDWNQHPWGQFVSERLPSVQAIGWEDATPRQLADQFLNAQLCQTPVRCQLVIDALSSELANHLNAKVAHDLGMVWNDLMRWSFDLRTMPTDIAERLQRTLHLSPDAFDPAQQRWPEVAQHARAISKTNEDLSWGHDLLGYVQWSAGDMASARQSFSNALRCSVFTDQSVRMRTHWATSSDGVAKFSARFLQDMNQSEADTGRDETGSTDANPDQLGRLPALIPDSELIQFCGRCVDEGEGSVRTKYSQMLIEKSEQASTPQTAARLLYAAGWDLGAEPLRRYGELLDRYIRCCGEAGWASHERLATVHRDGLKARYNL